MTGPGNGQQPVGDALPAWFLGPKSENADHLEALLLTVLRDYAHWRRNYFPSDEAMVSKSERLLLDSSYAALTAAVTELTA